MFDGLNGNGLWRNFDFGENHQNVDDPTQFYHSVHPPVIKILNNNYLFMKVLRKKS